MYLGFESLTLRQIVVTSNVSLVTIFFSMPTVESEKAKPEKLEADLRAKSAFSTAEKAKEKDFET